MQKLLSSSDTKFSSLTYKEMCSSQKGELTIRSSELRGLSKLLGRDFFLWRMIGENIAGCSTFMNDFVVQAQLSVDQLSVCVFGSLYDFVYYLLSPFNEQTYPQRETLNFSVQEPFSKLDGGPSTDIGEKHESNWKSGWQSKRQLQELFTKANLHCQLR